jgi:hypothetical protein
MFKALTVVAMIQSMVNQAMSQPNCEFVKIAEDYVRQRWPFIDVTDRRRSISVEGAVWKVRFTLPDDTLGFVPEIGIDQRDCQVVSAIVWQ